MLLAILQGDITLGLRQSPLEILSLLHIMMLPEEARLLIKD